MKTIIITLILTSLLSLKLNAQCPNGQANLTIDVLTDSYGYECFWDITPLGNGCGIGALQTFGNINEVNCSSGGSRVATSGGYANNVTITETIGCLAIGSCYSIHYVDDFGDGGATFTVNIDGFSLAPMVGAGNGNTFSFCINNHDVSLSGSSLEYTSIPISQSSNIIKPVLISSEGTQLVTGVFATVNVLLGSDIVFTNSSSPVSIAAGDSSIATFASFIPSTVGDYIVNYNSSMNEIDGVSLNNIHSYSVTVSDSVYARDNGVKVDQIGIGAHQEGHLGNKFAITNIAYLTSISAMIGNTDGTLTDSIFTLEVFNIDETNTPTSLLTNVSGIISSTVDSTYTLKLTPPLEVVPGNYLVAIKESAGYRQQIAYSDAIFTEGSVFVSWTSHPWAYTESFGRNVTYIIRPNFGNILDLNKVENKEIIIYPNPVSDFLHISTNNKIGGKIELYDNLGNLIKSQELDFSNQEFVSMDLSELSTGLYMLKFTTTNEEVVYEKILKR